MKNKKYCEAKACCWSYRHELLGVILLILATVLTVITCNSFGIVAMFFVGLVLCGHKYLCCHGSHCHSNEACDASEGDKPLHKADKSQAKKSMMKAKAKIKA